MPPWRGRSPPSAPPEGVRALLAALLLAAGLPGAELALAGPAVASLSWDIPPGATGCSLRIAIPDDRPPDLQLTAALSGRHGGWWQRALGSGLASGTHGVTLSFDPRSFRAAEGPWLVPPTRLHLLAATAEPSAARLAVELEWTQAPPPPPPAPRLRDIRPGPLALAVGERYEVEALPEPPLAGWGEDPELWLEVRAPDGSERRIPGFLRQPMQPEDRGDHERMRPTGPPRLACRFRPEAPGRYALRLVARWADGSEARAELPDLAVHGAAASRRVRIDTEDPRFFQIDGAWWWPIGLNVHNPYDLRSAERLGTRRTPPRGTQVYLPLIDRLAAAGIDSIEVWMSAWNLALVWHSEWPEFHGLAALNLANAERLDLILDHAWQRGVRVLLALHNHGQASERTDREWQWNPLNRAHGGPCAAAAEVFTHPAALDLQARLRRYVAARYGDHPALWGWKLWTEIDLTAGRPEDLRRWHEQAAAHLRALDATGRPITTHWSGDFRRVDPAIAALPGIEFLTIDAYRNGPGPQHQPALELIVGATDGRLRSLERWRKPVLVTEYGAQSSGELAAWREVDHRIGGWVSLVAGHAGAAMLWWWEWVDQGERWQPYRALRAFVAGEDLRRGRGQTLEASAPGLRLWARAWMLPQRVLGYAVALPWARDGGAAPTVSGAAIRLAEQWPPRSGTLAWWDADRGQPLAQTAWSHPGGPVELRPPDFVGHIAWKLALDAPP